MDDLPLLVWCILTLALKLNNTAEGYNTSLNVVYSNRFIVIHFLKLTSCFTVIGEYVCTGLLNRNCDISPKPMEPFLAVTSFLGLIEAWDYKENKNRSLRRSLKQIRYSKSYCMIENGSNHW